MISFNLTTIFSAQNSFRTQRSHPTSISSSSLPQGKGQHSTLAPPRLENPMSTEVPTETAGSGNKGQPYQIQRLLNNDPENDTTVLGFVFQRSLANEDIIDDPSSPNNSNCPGIMAKQVDLQLRCPIRAHADQCIHDGEEVGLPACRKDQTFKAIDKLNEHLSRVHSHKYLCMRCKKKFPLVSKIDLESLKEKHKPCEAKNWPEKKKHWAKWTLMSAEQYERWAGTAWTNSVNERRQPEDGSREKKPFWSWRKIYERLYPSTTNFPAASLVGGGLEDVGKMVSNDTDQRTDARPSGERQQPSVDDASGSPKPLDDIIFDERLTPILDFLSPYSADRGLGQEWRPETESQRSWPETSTGPESMAFSSTSGTTDNMRPMTPSFISFTDDLSTAWPLQFAEPHPYAGERDKDIFEGNPQNFFRREDQSFHEVADEGEP
ncbi:hypothetical protein BHE90_006410 [Fusarium euwallaceae]|uniref:Uncharacterized protein n=1 Tax=Fusarium euwallaceae TaxID=1147111 RepID=A0A430LTM4_9HYPO|nr:hypothetical protein BHE90_006410 [Fusarium euwallaceae]